MARWNLRYAAHLGFRSPDAPLFPASAGASDPLTQIEFAASIGFAGIQDPWFATRPPATQETNCRLDRPGCGFGAF
jgi:hydroxypyruvate isomerase